MPHKLVRYLLALVITVLFTGGTALANSAPPRFTGDGAGVLLPWSDSHIRVVEEDLQFVLDPQLHRARVTATYRMANSADRPVEVEMAFAYISGSNTSTSLGTGQNPTVTVNGTPVTVTHESDYALLQSALRGWLDAHPAVAQELARLAPMNPIGTEDMASLQRALQSAGANISWEGMLDLVFYTAAAEEQEPSRSQVIAAARELLPQEVDDMLKGWAIFGDERPLINPVTGERTVQSFYGGGGGLQWAIFTVPFPAGGEREITVSYTHMASVDNATLANPIYQYDYLLSPARSWAGFGPLRITVSVPPSTYLSSSIPLTANGDGLHTANLAGLPDEELHIAVMSRAGLLPGVGTADGYWKLLFALAGALGILPGWLLGRVWARRRLTVAILLSLFGTGLLGLVMNGVLLGVVSKLWRPAVLHGSYAILGWIPALLVATLISVVISLVLVARRRTAPPQ